MNKIVLDLNLGEVPSRVGRGGEGGRHVTHQGATWRDPCTPSDPSHAHAHTGRVSGEGSCWLQTPCDSQAVTQRPNGDVGVSYACGGGGGLCNSRYF